MRARTRGFVLRRVRITMVLLATRNAIITEFSVSAKKFSTVLCRSPSSTPPPFCPPVALSLLPCSPLSLSLPLLLLFLPQSSCHGPYLDRLLQALRGHLQESATTSPSFAMAPQLTTCLLHSLPIPPPRLAFPSLPSPPSPWRGATGIRC